MNTVEKHCKKYAAKNCTGCPFVGSECVAPVGDSRFLEWFESMKKRIEALY